MTRACSLGADRNYARGHLIGRGLHGLTEDGLLKVAGTEVHGAAAEAVPVSAAAQQ